MLDIDDTQGILYDDMTVDECLHALIRDTTLLDVVSCLDLIANERGVFLKLFDKDGKQEYPVQ
jgi:hypothetical protein